MILEKYINEIMGLLVNPNDSFAIYLFAEPVPRCSIRINLVCLHKFNTFKPRAGRGDDRGIWWRGLALRVGQEPEHRRRKTDHMGRSDGEHGCEDG